MWFAIAIALAAVGFTTAAQVDEERYVRNYDAVVDATTESLTLRLANGRVRMRVSTVHNGQRRTAIPKRIELLIIEHGPLINDARAVESSVAIRADARLFVRGTRNPRDVAFMNAVAVVCTYDDFKELANAQSIDGDAFGHSFVLAPEQLSELRALADRWMLPDETP